MTAPQRVAPLSPSWSSERAWDESLPVLRKMAYEARKRSQVWRPFNVGVSALVRIGHSYKLFEGANRKLSPGTCPHRRCGEMEVLDKVLRDPLFEEVIGYYIAAPPQPDDMSGKDLGALVPCVFCRNRFRQFLEPMHPLPEPRPVITERTKFVCENVESGYPLKLSMPELMEIGQGDEPSMVYVMKA